MSREMKYEALVSAKTRDEAIEIALEAMPRGRSLVRSEAEDVSAAEGPDSFRVTIVYSGVGADELAD
jgi:hypothetical protein